MKKGKRDKIEEERKQTKGTTLQGFCVLSWAGSNSRTSFFSVGCIGGNSIIKIKFYFEQRKFVGFVFDFR